MKKHRKNRSRSLDLAKDKRNSLYLEKCNYSNYEPRKNSRSSIKINISLLAFERLLALSNAEQLSRWKMLTRLIITQLPFCNKIDQNNKFNQRNDMNDTLLSIDGEKTTDSATERQVTYQMTTIAYERLESYKKSTYQSKAQIIEFLILNYQPKTPEQKYKLDSIRDNFRRRSHSSSTDTSISIHPAKFINKGGSIFHIKGIAPEKWDNEEIDEFEKIVQETIEIQDSKEA